MNWKHLLWIVPLALILGLSLGFNAGLEAPRPLEKMALNVCMNVADQYAKCIDETGFEPDMEDLLEKIYN